MKGIFKKTTAVTLTLALTMASVCGGVRIQGVTPEVKEAQAAETGGKYIRDLKICYADNASDAQAQLGDDYTVLKRSFNGSRKTNSYIGYSTTDNPEDAIRDIKVEEMTGKHSVSEYEKIQKEHQDAIKKQVDTFIPALIEFTKNYDADLTAARIIAMYLNYYYEDDSDEALGDYLLKQGRRLIADIQDADARQALEKVYIEGNTMLVQSMEDMITQGIDPRMKKKGSWLTRMSELGPKGLIKEYKLAYPNLKSEKSVLNQLSKEYGNEVKTILNEISEVQKYLREGEGSELVQAVEDGDAAKAGELLSEETNREINDELNNDMTVEEIAESMADVADAIPETMDAVDQSALAGLTVLLKGTSYGDQTMYDFFMREDLTEEDLYPMAYVLSDGQKAIMEDTGLIGIFQSASSEFTEASEDLDTMPEKIGEKVFSIYEGVDRDMFKGDTALTADALARMAATDDNEALTNGAGRWNYVAATVFGAIGIVCLMDLKLHWSTLVKTKQVLINAETTAAFKKTAALIETLEAEMVVLDNSYQAVRLKLIEKYQYVKGFKANLITNSMGLQKQMNQIAHKLVNSGNMEKIRIVTDDMRNTVKADVQAELDKAVSRQNELRQAKTYKKVKVPKYGARITLAVAGIASLAFAGYELYQMLKPAPSVKFTEIPAKMVSRTYDEENEISYVSYSVVRTPDGKKADLHNWEGKQWIALYTTSDEAVGGPILASGLKTAFTPDPDADAVPVTEFCYSDSFELIGIGDAVSYMSFMRESDEETTEPVEAVEETIEPEVTEEPEKPVETAAPVSDNAAETETASVFAFPSFVWIILIVVLVVGVGAGTVVMIRKRKKSE